MHDLLLAKEILDTAIQYAGKHGLARISEIMIELGSIENHAEEILPENLKEIFKLVAKGGAGDKASLKIKKVKGNSWKLKYIK